MIYRIPYRTNFYPSARDAIAGTTPPCCTLDAGQIVFYDEDTGVSMAIVPTDPETVFADIPWTCFNRGGDRND